MSDKMTARMDEKWTIDKHEELRDAAAIAALLPEIMYKFVSMVEVQVQSDETTLLMGK
jgi:hypothetical protein